MLSRRHLLRGLVALAAGCNRSPSASTTPAWPRTRTDAGVESIELFPGGATPDSPLVVALHGRGDRPDRWVADWSKFPRAARIALPRAFDPLDDGFSWFTFEDGMTDEQFGAVVAAAEARLWAAIERLAAGRPAIVTGFSQGGILSFALASRHPGAVSHAFPCAGACPGPLLPRDKAKTAPIVAFHGTDDDVLAIRWAREAVEAFQREGNSARLVEYPGLGHRMSAAMHADLWAAIGAALPA